MLFVAVERLLFGGKKEDNCHCSLGTIVLSSQLIRFVMAVGHSWCVLVIAMATVAVHCSDMQDLELGKLLQDDTILPAAQSTDDLTSAVVAYLIEQHEKKQEQEQEEFIKALIELTKFQTLVSTVSRDNYSVRIASSRSVASQMLVCNCIH